MKFKIANNPTGKKLRVTLKAQDSNAREYDQFVLKRKGSKFTFAGIKGMWEEPLAEYSFKPKENLDTFITIINKFVNLDMTRDELLSKAPGFILRFDADGKNLKAEDMALSKRKLNALEPSSMQEVVSLTRRFLARDIPVMLLGSSGFSKSALIREAATSIPSFPVKAENVKDIRAGQMNVEDLKGLPRIVNTDGEENRDFTKDTVPSWLKEVILKPNENFVLFFDELNHASPAVLNAVYGIILERSIDDYDFKGRVRIASAGNKADQNEDLSELSDPLIRRFEIIDIDKAIDNEIGQEDNFFTSWIRNEFKGRIPDEILKLIFSLEEETGDARTITRLLNAWADDIAEGEEFLTRSMALPPGLYAKIQKIYRDQVFKTTGSQKHKELIDEVTEYVSELKKSKPELFIPRTKSYLAADLVGGKLTEGTRFDSEYTSLSDEGKKIILKHFSNYQPELIEAALSKF